jgi:hypothetical protein
MDKIKIKITNPSSGSVQYVAKGLTINIPGHRLEENPFETEIPEKLLKNFKKILNSRFPFIRVAVVKSTAEPEEGPKDGQENPGPKDPEENDAPEKDDFFAACIAKKESGDTWSVIVPSGEKISIEGVTHHQQAKLVAYEKLYGENE